MNIDTVVKVAHVTLAASATALAGIGFYCAKQEVKLNRSIDEGCREIARGNKMMSDFIASIK